MIIHVRHVLSAGLCAKGLRRWCHSNDVDLRRFCKEGLPADELARFHDDPFAQRVIEAARHEEMRDA